MQLVERLQEPQENRAEQSFIQCIYYYSIANSIVIIAVSTTGRA